MESLSGTVDSVLGSLLRSVQRLFFDAWVIALGHSPSLTGALHSFWDAFGFVTCLTFCPVLLGCVGSQVRVFPQEAPFGQGGFHVLARGRYALREPFRQLTKRKWVFHGFRLRFPPERTR